MPKIDVLFVIEYNKLSMYDDRNNRVGTREIPNDMPRDEYLSVLARCIHSEIPLNESIDPITLANSTRTFRIEWDVSTGRTALEFRIDAINWNGLTDAQRINFLCELPLI